MSQTAAQARLKNLALNQAIPPDSVFRVDLLESDFQILLLKLVDGVNSASAGASKTPNIVGMAASATQVIPVGSKGWTITILTGTATVNGAAVSAGFSDSDPGTTLATITVATGVNSSAYVRWST